MLLIGGGIAAVGIVAYLLVRKGNSGTIANNTINGSCPAGQVPCSNNRLKCYDPMANYVINPCSTPNTTPTTPSTNDPVVEIIDGVIKLFKKKPAATAPTA